MNYQGVTIEDKNRKCKMSNNKIYKPIILAIINNLRIVNMLPGDQNGLPDAFYTNSSLEKYEGDY